MEYMILLYSDESATPDFQPGSAEFDEMMGAWMAFNDELGAAGQLVSGASLQPTATATVVGKSGDGSFTITNPMPRAISYQADAREDGEVSVDGGRTWGKLGMLQIGSRLATPEDVTHIRWRIPAESVARGRGNIAYSGIVR